MTSKQARGVLILAVASVLVGGGVRGWLFTNSWAAAQEPDATHTNVKLGRNGLLRNVHGYDFKGTTLVPIRGICAWLGATVTYTDGSIEVTLGDKHVLLRVGSKRAKFDGQPLDMVAPVTEFSGVACAPIRPVTNALGATVAYSVEDWLGWCCPHVTISHQGRKAVIIVHEEPPHIVAKFIGDMELSAQEDRHSINDADAFTLGEYGIDWLVDVHKLTSDRRHFESGFIAWWEEANPFYINDGRPGFGTNAAGIYGIRNGKWRLLFGTQDTVSIEVCQAIGFPLDIAKEMGFEPYESGEHLIPIHLATSRGDLAKVEALLRDGAAPNAVAKWGKTPLHVAAEKNYAHVAQVLLDYGVTVDSRDEFDATPLHTAATEGSTEVAALLLAHGADPNASNDTSLATTPLHEAARWGHSPTVKLLLEWGANVHARDSGGGTPLHSAAFSGDSKMAALLINHGADVTARNSDGWTPLHAAAWGAHGLGGSTETAEVLLKQGADVNAQNAIGQTPLDRAVEAGSTEVVELLRRRGGVVTSATRPPPPPQVEEIAAPSPRPLFTEADRLTPENARYITYIGKGYSVSSLSFRKGIGVKIMGQITTPAYEPTSKPIHVELSLVAFDRHDGMLGSGNIDLYSIPSGGATVPFEVSLFDVSYAELDYVRITPKGAWTYGKE